MISICVLEIIIIIITITRDKPTNHQHNAKDEEFVCYVLLVFILLSRFPERIDPRRQRRGEASFNHTLVRLLRAPIGHKILEKSLNLKVDDPVLA